MSLFSKPDSAAKPSAEDLDAVAAEQAVAEATEPVATKRLLRVKRSIILDGKVVEMDSDVELELTPENELAIRDCLAAEQVEFLN